VARCPTQSLQIISPDRGLTAPRRRCLRESGN
jgi:hypothetical protein